MRSSLKITVDRRLLTPRRTAKMPSSECVCYATARLRRDVGDLSTLCEFACGLAAFRWRFTRNKVAFFCMLTSFWNNGHDARSKTVLAPFSRHGGRSAISAPTLRQGSSALDAGVLIRSAHPRSSVASGSKESEERVFGPVLELASWSDDLVRGAPCPGKGLLLRMSELLRATLFGERCPQLCGKRVK